MTPRDQEKLKRSRRTYGIVENFAEKFDSRELTLADNAAEVEISDPLRSSVVDESIADITGRLVSEFFRRRDNVDDGLRDFENRQDNDCLQRYHNYSNELLSLVVVFQEVIQQLKGRNLINEEGEYQQFRQKNTELEARVGQLSRDLKKCRDEFETYKRTVKPLSHRKNPEYGDVVGEQ